MTPAHRRLMRVAAVALLLPLAGCGYSLAGRGSFLPDYIKIIGVPTFVNDTPVYDVERRLTERVRSEFIGRGKWTVKPEATGVDAVLSGEVASITLTPAAFAEGQASRYVLTLTAKIEFKDVKTGKVLWANPAMQFREEYDIANGTTADASTFFGQDQNALDRVALEFARAIVSAILEAF
jgi:outer membrane lipopolysaccharide assembly protein LptE/RlpB